LIDDALPLPVLFPICAELEIAARAFLEVLVMNAAAYCLQFFQITLEAVTLSVSQACFVKGAG
jgi:hypothetical protein